MINFSVSWSSVALFSAQSYSASSKKKDSYIFKRFSSCQSTLSILEQFCTYFVSCFWLWSLNMCHVSVLSKKADRTDGAQKNQENMRAGPLLRFDRCVCSYNTQNWHEGTLAVFLRNISAPWPSRVPVSEADKQRPEYFFPHLLWS